MGKGIASLRGMPGTKWLALREFVKSFEGADTTQGYLLRRVTGSAGIGHLAEPGEQLHPVSQAGC
jgi:hypothetical protein